MSVNGKVVIITGGASGVGQFVAGTFAQAAARVVVADVAPMDRVISEVAGIGAEILAVTTDVRIEDDVQELMRGSVRTQVS